MKLSKEAKVGLLVTASLAALLWGLNYLKGKDVFTSRNNFYAVYPSVEGLVQSNPVFMNGLRIGIVNDIDFMPDNSGRLLVQLLIDNDVFISKNSVARIFNADLIGTKAMRIELGDNPQSAENGDTLLAMMEFSLTQQLSKEAGPLKEKTERLIVSIDSTVTMIRQLFDPATKNNLRSGINHLSNSLASFDKLTDANGRLTVMVNNMASITSNLKENNEQISKIINNLESISDSLAKAQFASAIANADRVLAESNAIMQKINSGQGSLGLLVNDQTLYNNLSTVSKDLDELVKDLKENPKRYLHFSVFGKKQ